MLGVFVMLAAGQAVAAGPIDLRPERLVAACTGPDCAPADDAARYRLPLPLDAAPLNQPDRAFDENVQECNLVGSVVCTSKPHMIVGAGENADRSLSARLQALN